SGEWPELVDRYGAPESDVVAAVEVALAGNELAGGFAGEIGVEGPADDPPHRPPGDEGLSRLAGDRVQGVIEPFPDGPAHLADAVGCGAVGERVDGDGPADPRGPEVGSLGVEQVAPGVAVAFAARELLGPAPGFLPFRGGAEPLAHPA